MPKYLITTCPHCKKEFTGEYYEPPDLVLSKIEAEYKKNSDGVYTRRSAYAFHKPNYKKCPLCQEPIDMNSWQEYKLGYGIRKAPPAVLWRSFKGWFIKFLP